MSERADHDTPPTPLSRRAVLRGAVLAAGVAAWSAPSVTSWMITPANAGSPLPTDDPADPAAAGSADVGSATPTPAPGELARTGAPVVPLAVGGAAAIGAGVAAVRHVRRHDGDDDAPPPSPHDG